MIPIVVLMISIMKYYIFPTIMCSNLMALMHMLNQRVTSLVTGVLNYNIGPFILNLSVNGVSIHAAVVIISLIIINIRSIGNALIL